MGNSNSEISLLYQSITKIVETIQVGTYIIKPMLAGLEENCVHYYT